MTSLATSQNVAHKTKFFSSVKDVTILKEFTLTT
jgi:hypothetical protein